LATEHRRFGYLYLFQRGVGGRTTRERIVSPRYQTVELDASAAAATPTGLPL
jgi:hypothetical protein